MKKALMLSFCAFGLFSFAPTAHADAYYNGCDNTYNPSSHGNVTAGAACTYGTNSTNAFYNTVPSNITAYAVELNVSVLPTGELWVKANGSADDGACTQILNPPTSLGLQKIVFDTPITFLASTTAGNLRVNFKNSSTCGVGTDSDMREYYTNNIASNYHVWYWTPQVQSQNDFFSTHEDDNISDIIFSTSTVPTSILGVSSTTASTFCDAQMPYDDSDIISATITYVPNGLCKLGFTLVVPSNDALNQFASLASTTKARFPFSYIASVVDVWDGLVASSTANSPTYTLNMHDWGFGSTTAMGNILPNVTVFSASTTKQYFPTGMFDLLKSLASIALIVGIIADIFFSTRRLMK